MGDSSGPAAGGVPPPVLLVVASGRSLALKAQSLNVQPGCQASIDITIMSTFTLATSSAPNSNPAPRKMSAARFACIFSVLCAAVSLASSEPHTFNPFISMAPAGYPRATTLANGTRIATCEKGAAGIPRIVLLTSLDADSVWNVTAVIVEDATGVDPDLANGFPLELPSGRILVAYRHHTGPPSARVYRIAVSGSDNGGSTWSPLAIVWEGPIGVWEPFLYVPPGRPNIVRVAYSAELTNGGEQDIVQQESSDGGATWGARELVVHTPGSRNGMPGIAALPDGSLLAVFEGFWTGVWGAFTVNSVRSFDAGATWAQGLIVYAPPRGSGQNAGSPQVAVCAVGGVVRVVFMTSVLPAAPRAASRQAAAAGVFPSSGAWPDGAVLALSRASLDAANASAPLNFTGAALENVPLVTASAYWPSFLNDAAGLAVVYQDTAGDAAMTESSYCSSAGGTL